MGLSRDHCGGYGRLASSPLDFVQSGWSQPAFRFGCLVAHVVRLVALRSIWYISPVEDCRRNAPGVGEGISLREGTNSRACVFHLIQCPPLRACNPAHAAEKRKRPGRRSGGRALMLRVLEESCLSEHPRHPPPQRLALQQAMPPSIPAGTATSVGETYANSIDETAGNINAATRGVQAAEKVFGLKEWTAFAILPPLSQ